MASMQQITEIWFDGTEGVAELGHRHMVLAVFFFLSRSFELGNVKGIVIVEVTRE